MKLIRQTLPGSIADRFGTFGRLQIGDVDLFTVEQPWRSNQPFSSCVPAGIYHVEPWVSPTHGACFILRNEAASIYKTYDEAKDVLGGRWGILFHVANTAAELQGCIAPGTGLGTPYGRWGVTGSADAMDTLHRVLKNGSHTLDIRWQQPPQWP